MPEWGMLPLPKRLVKAGHRDMLRISDARMSGTSYGACVLHVAPESFVGGPLALLGTGDTVRIDLPARRLDMLVDEAEIARRRAAWVAPEPRFERGYGWMFQRHVGQANEGCDFDFLARGFGRAAGEPDIF
jgi:dihydroxy-acid dehydratase